MTTSSPPPRPRARLHELLDRLSRVVAADGWHGELNPVQRATLVYLSRANRFSRSPSHVADYLLVTRGTVSQTLKTLARRSLVTEIRSAEDRRSIRYELTDEGLRLTAPEGAVQTAVGSLDDRDAASLGHDLEELLRRALAARGGRSFGVCRTCRHHRSDTGSGGARCALLDVSLRPEETTRLCHEHAYTEAP